MPKRPPDAGEFFKQQLGALIGGTPEEEVRVLVAESEFLQQRFGSHDRYLLEVRLDLLELYRTLGRLDDASKLAASLPATAPAQGTMSDLLEAYRAQTIGRLLLDQGHYLEAEALFHGALANRLACLGPDHADTLLSLNSLAYALDLLGRMSEAEPLLRRALDARLHLFGERDLRTANSLNNLAWNLSKQDRLAEAEPLYQRAWAIKSGLLLPIDPAVIEAAEATAMNLALQGKFAEASPIFANANEVVRQIWRPSDLSRAKVLGSYAQFLEMQGKHKDAEPILREVLAAFDAHPEAPEPAKVSAVDALIQNLLAQPDRAYLAQAYSERLELLLARSDSLNGFSPIAEEQVVRHSASEADHWLDIADSSWFAAARDLRLLPVMERRALAAMQRSMEGAASRAIALRAASRLAREQGAATGALVEARQGLIDQWSRLDQLYVASLGELTAETSKAVSLIQTRKSDLEQQIARIDGRLRNAAPSYFAMTRPSPVSIARVRHLLGRSEAALLIVPTDFGTHILAVTRRDVVWKRVSLNRIDLSTAVATLRNGLDPAAIARTNATFDRRLAFRLYQALIEPVASQLAGSRQVFVVTTGALAGLPLQVLVTSPPHGADDNDQAMRATQWLADAWPIVQLPSLTALDFLRRFRLRDRGGPGKGGLQFEGFGDPQLDGVGAERGRGSAGLAGKRAIAIAGQTRDGGILVDANSLRKLPGLPGTAAELEKIRLALHAADKSLHILANDTERQIRTTRLDQVDVLVIATHGLVAGEVRGISEPGLVFTPPAHQDAADDGFLSASEIADLRLDADLVVLSACNSASGSDASSPPLSGLARALFFAGAHSVLASHWPVFDDVAPRITIGLINAVLDGHMTKAAALQKTLREIRNDPADPSLAYPSAWAPFVIIGDGR